MLDNREISSAIWLSLFLTWGLSKSAVRKAATGVVKAAFVWKIVLCVFMAMAYNSFVVFALHSFGLWDVSNLKTTLLWVFTAALVMVFDVKSAPNDDRYFQKAILDGLKVSVILEFIVNLHVFSLPLELVLVPFATLLVCMLVIAENKEEFKSARTFLNGLIAVVTLALISYSIYRIYLDFNAFAQFPIIIEFLLPLVLTTLFVPFLYVLTTIISYENIFFRLQFFMKDPNLQSFAKGQLILHFGLNFRGLNRWARRIVHDQLNTRVEILDSIRRGEAS